MKVVNSGGSDKAVSDANLDRKHDALTEKDVLVAILNRLTNIESILTVGVEPDHLEIEQLNNNKRDYNGY